MREELSSKEKLAQKLYVPIRLCVLLGTVLLFFPSLNPASFISKAGPAVIKNTASLFTCAVSYKSLVNGLSRALSSGWVEGTYFVLLYIFCILLVLGIVASAVAQCFTLGNLKMKNKGNTIGVIGAVIQTIGAIGILISYFLITGSCDAGRIEFAFKGCTYLYVVLAVIVLLLNIIITVVLPKASKEDKFEMESQYKLFLMMLPFIFLCFAFSYLPLFSWRYAFFDYNAGDTLSMDKFVGFKWFKTLFQNSTYVTRILNVLKNTLAMSGLGLLTSWLPMAFAIFLTEIKNMKYRRFVQTFTTVPNFISWVLIYAIAYAIFNTDGFINSLFGGDSNYLNSASHMWLKMLAWGTWKGVGWSAIIYISGIAGIDQQLYEAATVDGAGRFQRMWHITLPGLLPTYVVMLIMQIAGILSNGLDQYLVFTNANNKYIIEVLDLYVYNLGIGDGQIPLSTVVGMSKSIISVILLFVANKVAKLIRGDGIV